MRFKNNPAAESVGDAVCGRRKFSKIYIDHTEGSRKTNSGWESYARAGPIPAEFPGHPIFYVWRGIYAPQVGDQSETWTCGLAKPAREDGLSIKNLKKVKIAKPAHFYRPGFNRSGPRSHTFSLKRRNFWLSPALSVPTWLPPRFPQRRRA